MTNSSLTSAAAIESLAIDIGGVPMVLCSDDPSFQAMVQERYQGFARILELSNLDVPALRFEVDVLRPGEMSADEEVQVEKTGASWRIRRGDFRAEVDLASGSGLMRQELNPYGLNSILRIVHSLYLADKHGFLLHAASAIRDGLGFIFSGVSGAGKTTISRCAPPDAVLLTDEISYVRRQDDHYRAWGTPFAGELGRLGENTSAPISRLFFLEKGPANRISDLDKAQAIRMLLRNILFFSQDDDLVSQVFASACDFVERVPVHRLTFVPNASVWNLIVG